MKRLLNGLMVMVLMVALAGGVYLVQKNQETRRGASGGISAVLSVNMGVTANPKVGDTFVANVVINVGEDKLTYFQTRLKIGQTDVLGVEKVELQSYTVDGETFNFGMTTGKYEEGMIKLGGSLDGAKIPSGAVTLAKVTFVALKPGTSTILLDTSVTDIQAQSAAGTSVQLATTLTPISTTIVANSNTDGVMTIKPEPASHSMKIGESAAVVINGVSPTYGCTAADFYLHYDKTKTELKTAVGSAGYQTTLDRDDAAGTLRVRATWISADDPVPGTFPLVTLVLVAKSAGVDSFSLTGNGQATGVDRTSTSTDKTMGVTMATNEFTYTAAEESIMCTDSDTGKIHETKGTTCVGTDCVTDSCNAAKTNLTEYFCDGATRKNEDYACGSDKQCVNGACEVVETVNGTDPVIDFKLSFYGLLPNGQCRDPLKLQLIVVGEDLASSKVYTEVGAVSLGVTNPANGQAVFEVKKQLTGFVPLEKVALFVRGPKYIQNKFGVNNQVDYYEQVIGELSLTKDYTTSTVYDFSGFPMLPGDIDLDGRITGLDFSAEKTDSRKQVTLKQLSGEDVGGTMPTGLNGDCTVNTFDESIMRNSFSVKQGQLY